MLWIDSTFNYIRIACNNRTIVAVTGFVVFFVFKNDIGHKNPVHFLICQIIDMPMHKFCRKADIVSHYRADPRFVHCHG